MSVCMCVIGIIKKAKEIKGSVLQLDILQAEQYLANRKRVIRAAAYIQRWRRGLLGRRRVKAIKLQIRAAKRHFKQTEEQAALLAKTWVPQLLEKCVKTVVKMEIRPVSNMICNLSGQYMYVTVYLVPRRYQRHDGTADGTQLHPCLACQTASTIKRYHPYDRSYSTERAVCTCNHIRSCEAWRIRAVDPLTCSSYYLTLHSYDLRTLLLQTVQLAQTPVETHLRRMVASAAAKYQRVQEESPGGTMR